MKPADLLERIIHAKEYACFGAGIYGYGLYRALLLATGKRPSCFLVSSKVDNPNAIDGIDVEELAATNIGKDTLILIATPDYHHEAISKSLNTAGFHNAINITLVLYHQIMDGFWRVSGLLSDYARLDGEVCHSVPLPDIWAICNSADLELGNKGTKWPAIQTGAALSKNRLGTVFDDTGDNISSKNPWYSELTATWWIWKNTKSAWAGLFHYRRHLALPDDLGSVFTLYDAVLPVPALVYPNAGAHHRRYVGEGYWKETMAVLMDAGHLDEAKDFFSRQVFYPHNIWVLRWDVLDTFCAWLFELLFAIEERVGRWTAEPTPRYMGYLAESLTSFYFAGFETKRKIAHADELLLL